MRIPTANLARFTLRSATSALLLLTACSDDASDDAATTQGGRGGTNAATAGAGGDAGRAGSGRGGGSGGTRALDAGRGGSGRGGAGGASGGGMGGRAIAGGSGGDGELANIGGCSVFTPDDAWNRDISGESADATWTARLQRLVGDIDLHPDYGNSGDEHYGIPINVVPGLAAQGRRRVRRLSGRERPRAVSVSRSRDGEDRRRHARRRATATATCSSVQQGACMLYEGYACRYEGGWHCANGAVWDLGQNSYGQRAEGLDLGRRRRPRDRARTRALRRSARGRGPPRDPLHRATAPATASSRPRRIRRCRAAAIPNAEDSPPMGLRVRLRADYDLSSLSRKRARRGARDAALRHDPRGQRQQLLLPGRRQP